MSPVAEPPQQRRYVPPAVCPSCQRQERHKFHCVSPSCVWRKCKPCNVIFDQQGRYSDKVT